MTNFKNTRKITVRFSSPLRNEMQQAIVLSGYGLHGKSRWLKDAIGAFLNLPNYAEYIEQGIQINQAELNQVEAFYIENETSQALKKALMEIRMKYPLYEGVQSALIRAAVVYKIMLKN